MRKPSPERKAEIVDTVIGLADHVGPDRITTDMIAKAIGVTQATIFRHFPKKGDIWNSVAMHLTHRMREAWEKIGSGAADPVARLETVVLGHLRLIAQMPALPAILLSRELHGDNIPLRKTLQRTMGSFHQHLTDLVAEAIAAGAFRKDLVASDAALLIIGMVQSLAMRWSISGRSEDLVATGERLLAVQIAGFLDPRHPTPPEGSVGA
ncbi:MAG: TetR/AcrR family transcriptional regulator [Rhodocyclaceae bacterium]|jgi:AcrR family transcriptional regulator|nr:TetR/AcrR family transcriptional regulator [Rhodocyclaceae bacterium]